MSVVGTQDSLGVVVARLLAREDELVALMLERNAEEVEDLADLGDRHELLEAVRESARGNLREALGALARDRHPPEHLPTGALEEARSAARSGIPLPSLLHTYRIGHAVVWEAIIDEVERLGLEAPGRHDLLRAITRYTFAYIDGVIPRVRDAYAEELARLEARRDRRRLGLVREVLDGATVDAAALGYELDAEHVGIVVSGRDGVGVVEELGRRLGRRALAVPAGERTTWGWLAGAGPWEEQLLRDLASPAAGGCTVAFGEPAGGANGFRATHRQAVRAHAVGLALRRPATRFRDVAFEALALQNEGAARAFVEAELAPLARAKDGAKLRATLVAYFACGLNAAAAAASLGIHDRTVGYRIRAVEDLIGCPLQQRRVELEAALRLERVLRIP